MAKRKSKPRLDAMAVLGDPILQSVVALLVVAVGVITLLALFGATGGAWSDPWVDFLHHWVGWGAYPVGAVILAGGLLWLAHQLDRPIEWRWRPIVGAELAFFSLLALTHAIVGRSDPWGLVQQGEGGGLVGWAIAAMASHYLGVPIAVVILSAGFVVGLGLVFDVTLRELQETADVLRRAFAGEVTGSQARRQARPKKKRPKPAPAKPKPEPTGSPPEPEEPPAEEAPAPVPSSVPQPPPRPVSVRDLASRMSPGQTTAPESRWPERFTLPPLDIFNEPQGPVLGDREIRDKSRIIEETLAQFGLPVEVAEVRVGPTVTQFGVRPGYVERSRGGKHKVRVNQISRLADDLALALAASRLRVEAPVPGRSIVGIEVPNNEVQLVGVREVMDTEEFSELDTPLAFALGKDVAGEPVVADLARMPHLLIAGTTGSGKSVAIKALTSCLISNNTPRELRLVMIDPKMVELVRYNGLPHLYGQVEVELDRLVKVLRWVALEMDDRYKRFADAMARNIDDYNQMMEEQGETTIPRIVVLVDELADLMMMAPNEVERTICRIAQMARATGIHLVVATQRPSVDVVTGLIKANFPARISFATASQTDSRVILDMPGAETLVGNGDMLYLAADAGYPVRVQGAFVSEEEVDRLVAFWCDQVDEGKKAAPWAQMMESPEGKISVVEDGPEVDEELLQEAIDLVVEEGEATASLLQIRLHIGHPRAARLMQAMEDLGVVGPPEGGGQARRVIIGGEG